MAEQRKTNIKWCPFSWTACNDPVISLVTTGNHEYYTHDVKNWLAHLESLGIKCLPNRNVKIADPERAQDWFYLAGTNDLQADRDMNDK